MIKLVYYKAVDNIQQIIDQVPKGLIEDIYVVDSIPPETHILVRDETTEEEKLMIDAEIKSSPHKTLPDPPTDITPIDLLVNEEREI